MKRRRLPRTYDCRVGAALGGIRRRVTAVLGIAIIVMTLLAPQLASSRPAFDMAFSAVVDGKMVICTGTGMMVIDLDGRPVDDDHGQDHASVFCLPFLKGMVTAPAVFELTAGLRVVFDQATTMRKSDVASPLAVNDGGTSPRGPPPSV